MPCWSSAELSPRAEGAPRAVALLLIPLGPRLGVFLPILPFANRAGNFQSSFSMDTPGS